MSTIPNKATREALYALAATIEASAKVNPKEAQKLQRVFETAIKTKGITADQIQRVTRGLLVQGEANADSHGVIKSPINSLQFDQMVLDGYNKYIGQPKNYILPGAVNFYGTKHPAANTPENARLAMILAGMGGGAGIGLAIKNATNNYFNNLDLGSRIRRGQSNQSSRVNNYNPKSVTSPQLYQDLDPAPRRGETPQQAAQRARSANTELRLLFPNIQNFDNALAARRSHVLGNDFIARGSSATQNGKIPIQLGGSSNNAYLNSGRSFTIEVIPGFSQRPLDRLDFYDQNGGGRVGFLTGANKKLPTEGNYSVDFMSKNITLPNIGKFTPIAR